MISFQPYFSGKSSSEPLCKASDAKQFGEAMASLPHEVRKKITTYPEVLQNVKDFAVSALLVSLIKFRKEVMHLVKSISEAKEKEAVSNESWKKAQSMWEGVNKESMQKLKDAEDEATNGDGNAFEKREAQRRETLEQCQRHITVGEKVLMVLLSGRSRGEEEAVALLPEIMLNAKVATSEAAKIHREKNRLVLDMHVRVACGEEEDGNVVEQDAVAATNELKRAILQEQSLLERYIAETNVR